MGTPSAPCEVLLLLAAFSRYDEALDWARRQASQFWGAVTLESPRFEFTETDFYQQEMGSGLRKVFFGFEKLIDPGTLPDLKLQTNTWEQQYAEAREHAEPRPLNLDPGYLSEGKLVLASTKDHAHRIYLRDGIFAEVTLNYRARSWQRHQWTYPDYQREGFHQFFDVCRKHLRERRRAGS